ncbi:YfiT family bacillithiol transferase [Ferruginibacter albus]|uniref:YfiT family bacillithiol transferase n=1 Tax=Ferruginibacter albus TaxID=2875540 RepID=UPI001CC5E904|nr:putative metal-dependent hydrolase [Ferruginibacter albus]UAY51373.1 putative metal-dependent hydrolase [Ferruginibacter albus]
MSENLSFPIGKVSEQAFTGKETYSEELKKAAIKNIESLPQLLEESILNLDESQLNTPYREGGWTVKQVVHHVADSHMNSLIRFKLGLTEDNPTIKPYDQDRWANLADTKNVPVNVSITLLYTLHTRLVEVLKSIKDEEWQRTVFHPEMKKTITLWDLLAIYSWHGRHHTAHITKLRERNSW